MADPSLLWSWQNSDGGWGYRSGASSATEPTAYAILALAGGGSSPQSLERGVEWLKSRQRPDGGWAPRGGVDQSTWVTALPLLLPASMAANFDVRRAVDWVVRQTGRESGWVYRLRLFLMGVDGGANDSNPGWPWYPETAAWVSPTALTILALNKIQRRQPSQAVEHRCNSGRAYLLARRCADAGWNHGSTRALGYDGPSYPETTGLALLALDGVKGLESSLSRAEAHAAEAKALEAASWLRLGLAAHGRPVPEAQAGLKPRTTVDLALGLIAAGPGNVFLD